MRVLTFLIISIFFNMTECKANNSKNPSSDQSALNGATKGLSICDERSPYISWNKQKDQIDLNALKAAIKLEPPSIETILKDFDTKTPKGKHPRLMADLTDFDRMTQLVKSGDPFFTKSYQSILSRAERFLKTELPRYEFDATGLRLTFPYKTQEPLIVTAFAYRMTKDERFAKKIKDTLLAYAGFESWGTKHFLDNGVLSGSLAIAFDWIYETLTPGERSTIVNAIITKALKPGINAIDYNASWNKGSINWNPVCNGGLSMAALAILDESDEGRNVGSTALTKALAGLPFYIREFEPDGQSVEGIHYFNFGMTSLIRVIESMRTVLGSDYNYSNTPGLARAASFPIYMSGPVIGVSIGDDPLKTQRSDSNFWFAKRFKNSFIANYHANEVTVSNNFGLVSVEDMLNYEPTMISSEKGAGCVLPLDNYIRDMEYISFRSSWVTHTAIFTGILAAGKKGAHSHLGAGSFDIQANGKLFAIGGLGNDDYTFSGYFDVTLPSYTDAAAPQKKPGRFHIYRLRTEGKNGVVINPDVRPDQDPSCNPQVEAISTNANDASADINLSPCYNRDVTLYKRSLGLVNHRSEISLKDRITTKSPSTLYWFMHTPASITLDASKRFAELTIDDQKMIAEIREPANAQFSIMDSVYLPSESFPLSRNSNNTFNGTPIKKLAIQLNNFKDGTIDVKFSF